MFPLLFRKASFDEVNRRFTDAHQPVKGAEGYEIRYSTSKKMKNAVTVDIASAKTTLKKITGLTGGKKYYVQIRTYIVADGKKIYSDWSKAKTVKTKK